jgi:hypothetical protein
MNVVRTTWEKDARRWRRGRVGRRLLGAAALVALILWSCAAEAGYRWTRVAEPTDVEVTYVLQERAEFRRTLAKYGHSRTSLALAVLVRRDGAYFCRIYHATPLTAGQQDHELRHCRGWIHD